MMVFKFVLLFFLYTSHIEGNELNYIFSDKADGWLKLYTEPLGWNDAKIRCDSEGAVLASPLAVQLRDEIKEHLFIVDRTIHTIYTGVQAGYNSGDFFSVEGVHVSSLSVPLLNRTNIDYKSSESCIAWDMSYNSLHKVKCESKYPYVCYKKRTSAQLPVDTGLGTRDPESNPGKQPITPGVRSQPDQHSQPPHRAQPDHRSQPTHGAQPEERSQPTYGAQPNPQSQPTHGSKPDQRPKPTHGAQPDQRSQPTDGAQPDHRSQPTYGAQPNPQSQPTHGAQPDQRSQPTHGAQPDQRSQPTYGAQPNQRSQSTHGAQPDQRPQPTHGSQPDQRSQPTYRAQPDQQSQPTHGAQPDQLSQPPHGAQPNQQPQPPHGAQPDHRSQPIYGAQPNQQSQPHHRTQLNHVPYEKCAIDGVNLFIINSELQFDALKALANNPTASIIFADIAYIKSLDESTWHVVVQKKPYQQGSSQPGLNETVVTASVDVNNLSPHFHNGIQSNVPQNQGSSTGSRNRPSSNGVVNSKIPVPTHHRNATLNYRLDEQTGWRMKIHRLDTWDAAQNQCANEGAVLASPLTTQLYDAIKRYLNKFNRSITTIYTGVHANFSNGDFYSTEGVPLAKMPVFLDSSANVVYDNSESCITMNTLNTVVRSVKCTDRYPYVCLKRTLVRGCGTSTPGYTLDYSSNSCYKFHQHGKTWTDAYTTCTQEGGYLAIINSQKESMAMKKLFAKYPPGTISGYYPDSVYIGFRDWLDGKSWVTVMGQSLQKSGYIGWYKTEPNNANGNENCGTFNRNGYFYDDPCQLKLAFICEKDSILVSM